jgi:diguanylate cyclase (GGDEF)-like protein
VQNVPLKKAGLGSWIDDLAQGRLVYSMVKDLPETEANFLLPFGTLSIAVAPVIVDGEWWASILFEECRRERQWAANELEAFQIAASIFGAAEAQSRTSKKLARRQLAMGLLQDIVTTSLQAPNMKEMAITVSNRLAELIGADGCYLTLWDAANQRTIPFAAAGDQNLTYTNLEIIPGELTFTRSVLTVEHTLIIEDIDNTIYAAENITKEFPSKSILALPLIAMDKKLGAVLVSFEQLHHFDQEEIEVCEQAASLIALALEKFQAMDAAQRRANTSETLRKAALAVVEQLELEQAVSHILEQLNQVVPYDSASIQLVEGNELVIIGGHGWSDMKEVVGIRFPIPGDNPNSEVIKSGKSLLLAEPWQIYKSFKQPPHDHIRSWLGVPLIAQDKIIGLLAIDSSEPNDFNEEDTKIASEFAGQVAVALENARVFQEAQNQAITDALTGIYNRRGLMELGQAEFVRAQLANRQFSAIMLDIDHFKKINDTYGHSAGDQVLGEFARRCKSCIREIDYLGRYGGEELIILLPETGMNASQVVAERLRLAITNTPVRLEDAQEITISASLGVACRDESTPSLETLIARADQALYMAKHNGRNRVAFSH